MEGERLRRGLHRNGNGADRLQRHHAHGEALQHLAVQVHVSVGALLLHDGAAEVDAALVLDEDVQLASGDHHSVLVVSLQHVDQHLVHDDVRAVVHLVLELQRASLGGDLVVHVAEVRVQRLERQRLLISHAAARHGGHHVEHRHGLGDRDGAVASRLVVLHRPLGDGTELGNGVADDRPLLRHVTGFGERRVVVVGGQVGLEVVVVSVRAGEEVVVAAAVVHVEVDGGVQAQHRLQRLGDGVRIDLVVLLLPVVEPSGVELAVHLRASLGVAHLRRELLLDVVAHAEVDGGVDVLGEGAALEGVVVGGIHSEEDDVVAEEALAQIQEPLEMGLIARGVEAVLVLDLDHDDTASVLVEVGAKKREKDVVEVLHVLLVDRIGGSQLDAGLSLEPVGQTAEVPLTADEGARTENDVHVVLLGNLDETDDVCDAVEVELSLARLVEVPGHVGLDGVQATVSHLLDGVFPVDVVLSGFLAEIVEGSRHVGEWLSVHLEVIVDDLEGSFADCERKKSKNQQILHRVMICFAPQIVF